jgi:hypothetical protein
MRTVTCENTAECAPTQRLHRLKHELRRILGGKQLYGETRAIRWYGGGGAIAFAASLLLSRIELIDELLQLF